MPTRQENAERVQQQVESGTHTWKDGELIRVVNPQEEAKDQQAKAQTRQS